jgi:hypothetical protein
MENLSNECIRHIHDYDNTYKILFEKVLTQLNNYSKWHIIKKNTYMESIPIQYHGILNLTQESIDDYNYRINESFAAFFLKICV